MSRAADAVLHSFYQSPSLGFEVELLVKSRCGPGMLKKSGQGRFEATRPIACMSNWRSLLTHGFLHRAGTAQAPAFCVCTTRALDARLQKRTHPAIAIDTAHCTKKFSAQETLLPKNRLGKAVEAVFRGDCAIVTSSYTAGSAEYLPGTAARELTACANTNRTPSATSASAA